MNKHYHCLVIGYKEEEKDTRMLHGCVDIELMGFIDENDALNRAKKIVTRPYYVLRKVWPCFICKMSNKHEERQ